jgi:extracellular matrix regulatory protein B
MYLHLGNDRVIAGEKVIAILNLEEPRTQSLNAMIEKAQLEKRLTNISHNDKRKALVVCEDQLYLSPISSHTLYKRASQYQQED